MNTDILKVEGALNLATMPAVLAATADYAHRDSLPDALSIDMTEVTEIDSSAVALLLHWRREAQKMSKRICYINLPDNLIALAKLYGVAELIHCPQPLQDQQANRPRDPYGHA